MNSWRKDENMIEVEARSFISEEKYNEFMNYFKKNTDYLGEDEQITVYFSGEKDLRTRLTSKDARIIVKEGKIHDKGREELEIVLPRKDFDNINKILELLGFKIKVKWFRKRQVFKWNDIKLYLDFTKGYGHTIELERFCNEEEKQKTHDYLIKKLKSLDLPLTTKEEFTKRFDYYVKNWRKLV